MCLTLSTIQACLVRSFLVFVTTPTSDGGGLTCWIVIEFDVEAVSLDVSKHETAVFFLFRFIINPSANSLKS